MEAAKRNEMAMVSLLEASEKSFEVQGHHHGGRSSFNLAELNILADSLKSVSWTRLLGLFGGLTRSAFWLALSQSGNTIINTLGFYIASQTGDVKVQSAFGLTIFFTIVSILSIVEPISEKIGVSCALSSGAGNYEATKANFLRGVVMFVFYVGLIFVPIILYSEEIYKMLGFEPETSLLCSQIQTKLFPMDLMRLTGSILLTYLISQGIETSFGLYVMANLVCGLAISYFLGIYHEMGLNGWMIGRLWFDMANLAMFIHGYFFRLSSQVRGLPNVQDIAEEFKEYLSDIGKFTIGLYGEIAGWEFAAFMTTLTKDYNQIAAHTAFINIAYFVYNIGLGFSSAARTRMNFLLGRNHPLAAKNFFIVVLFGLIASAAILGGFIYLFKEFIADFYSADTPKAREYLISLLSIYVFMLPADFLYSYMFTAARTTRQLFLNNVLNVSILCVGQFLVSYYLITRLHASCVEVVVVLYFCIFLIFGVLLWRFVEIKWEGDSTQLNESLEIVFEVSFSGQDDNCSSSAAGISKRDLEGQIVITKSPKRHKPSSAYVTPGTTQTQDPKKKFIYE